MGLLMAALGRSLHSPTPLYQSSSIIIGVDDIVVTGKA
jgi:hypothetical protein